MAGDKRRKRKAAPARAAAPLRAKSSAGAVKKGSATVAKKAGAVIATKAGAAIANPAMVLPEPQPQASALIRVKTRAIVPSVMAIAPSAS